MQKRKLINFELKEFIKKAKIKRFKKNELIFSKNDYGKFFYIVKNGKVRLFTSFGRKTKIFADISENEFFGELALFGIKYRTANAIALTDCELYTICEKEFKKTLFKSKKIILKMFEVLAKRLKKADEEIERLIFTNLFGRVILFLYEKCRVYGNVKLTMTQNEIANHIGTTRIPINRVLRFLSKRKIIKLSRGNIEVNLELLKKISMPKEVF